MNNLRQLSVESWHAWAPGVQTAEQWQAFLADPYPLPDEKADVAFLPAIKRRRLSPLARAAFYVSRKCMAEQPPCPAIYSCIYGETQRCDTILQSIASDDDMSPTAFGLSVHNAIAGQSSILFGNKQPILAEAPGEQGYLSAFVDALGQLHEGKQSVLLVFYEEKPPPFFAPFCRSTDFACALAVKVTLPVAQAGRRLQLDFTGQAADAAGHGRPDLLRFIGFFARGDQQLQLGSWQLTQC